MRHRAISSVGRGALLSLLCLLVAAGASGLAPGAAWAASDTYDWYHGADGYQEALELARAGNRPLIVFFHVEWCGWCKRLQKEYLDAPDVYDTLGDYLRVEINPEKGAPEKTLEDQYHIRSYPAFLVSLPGVATPLRLSPFNSNDSNQTTEEFIAQIKRAVVRQYLDRGFLLLSTNENEQAMHTFATAQRRDPDNAEAYFGMGECYWVAARTRHDPALLRKAEQQYGKALEKKPEYDKARAALERLRTAQK